MLKFVMPTLRVRDVQYQKYKKNVKLMVQLVQPVQPKNYEFRCLIYASLYLDVKFQKILKNILNRSNISGDL